LTKLDILTGIEKLKICVGYRTPQGKFAESLPSNPRLLAQCEPLYEELEGWKEDITKARKIGELPSNTRRYIERLEELAGIKSVLVSVGAGREETIVLKNPFIG
jgi:adenylosuccinate synthase